MRAPPSSRTLPAAISFLAIATSSSGLRTTATSVIDGVMEAPPMSELYRIRALDPEDPRRLGLHLDRRVIDAEPRVEHGVERLEQPLALADVVDDDVRAHRLAA